MNTIPLPWLHFTGLTINDIPQIKEPAYPPEHLRFQALALTPPNSVRVIILGQDPYHNENEANGLAFSVPSGIRTPPSLRNIFKELHADLNISTTETDLTCWAQQGVLLLNTALSVAPHQPASHADIGWNKITDAIIQSLGQKNPAKAFILWGKHAQKKAALISNEHNHLILQAPHPSPLSAHRGFFGSKPFSKVNTWLNQHNLTPIEW